MKPLLIIIGLFSLIALIALFLLWPSYQEFSSLKEQIKLRSQELQTRQAYFENLRSQDAKLAEYKTQVATIDAALPEDPSLPLLYDLIQDSAATSGLVLRKITASVNPALADTESSIKQVSSVLELRGSYLGFKGFLASLEHSWRIIQIQSIELSSEREGPVDFIVRLSAFSY
ncbi:MAG: type 4a pilus biogenesis protein PilO [Candidatus Wildermuthbacteria bacterium]|nr:type 4a pilus biogenesis protein PilO [Candidatus Wildermuthbacteria bacterium]